MCKRVYDFHQAEKDVEARHPGESSRSWRARLVAHMATCVAAVESAFSRSPVEQQRQYIAAADRWAAYKEVQAEDCEMQPCLDDPDGVFLDDKYAQYLDEVMTCVSEYFICRRSECRNVTSNLHWISKRKNEHYRPDGLDIKAARYPC
jgi:hypothetical protein